MKWLKLEKQAQLFEESIRKIGKDKLLQELLDAQGEAKKATKRARELYLQFIEN